MVNLSYINGKYMIFSGIVDVSDQTRFEINLEKLSMDDKRILLENVIRRVYDNNITDLDSKVIDYFKYNLLKKKGRQITIYDLESENIVGFALQNIEMFSKNIDQIRNQFEFFVFNKELNVFQNLKETESGKIQTKKIFDNFLKRRDTMKLFNTSKHWAHHLNYPIMITF